MTLIRINELHEAQNAGDGGIRRLMNGSRAIPLGLNPMYKSPVLQARKEWEAARAAGGRDSEAGKYPALAHCSNCDICIGRGYVEREIYLVATDFHQERIEGQRISLPAWRYLCGTCASTLRPDHATSPLHFGFALICEADWGVPSCHNLTHLHPMLVRQKIADLNRQTIPAWNRAFAAIKHMMASKGATKVIDITQARRPAFERFIWAFEPTPLTYSDLLFQKAA